MPDYTCPHIDTIQDWAYKSNQELEKLRTMNSELRDILSIGRIVAKKCKKQ